MAVFAVALVAAAAPIRGGLAAPLAGNLVLASITSDGTKQNGHAEHPAISADGARVAFKTSADNLDPLDPDAIWDIYVKDLATGELILASISADGTKSNGSSDNPSLSDDGTSVAFDSIATNLDPRDTDPDSDVYVKDLVTGELTLASTSETGEKADGDSLEPALAGNGERVGFTSYAANLDPRDHDELSDIYVKDLPAGDVTLASASSRGADANGRCSLPALSTDGVRAAFNCNATNLDPRDHDEFDDVFVKDLGTGQLTLASTTSFERKGNDHSNYPDLSGTGLVVAFNSAARNLDRRDHDNSTDVYVKDLVTGELTLASTRISGVKGNNQSLFPTLSADGARVAFGSLATNLDRRDRDTASDIYIKDLATGFLSLASTSDVGTKGDGTSEVPFGDSSGTVVAFQSSSDNLDPLDPDTRWDIYAKVSD